MARVKEISFKEIRFEAFLIFIRDTLIDIDKINGDIETLKALISIINEKLLKIEKKVKE
ncbi:hypothetical protein [Campylobacter hominis]